MGIARSFFRDRFNSASITPLPALFRDFLHNHAAFGKDACRFIRSFEDARVMLAPPEAEFEWRGNGIESRSRAINLARSGDSENIKIESFFAFGEI
jgi:hypothetical protein